MVKFTLKFWANSKVIKSVNFDAENMEDAKSKVNDLAKKTPFTARMSQSVTVEKFTF